MDSARCAHCGRASRVVQVHGHGQCSFCHTNVDPCCSGADAANEIDAAASRQRAVAEQQLSRVFAHLGGAEVTVTREALTLGLANGLGLSLDEAQQIIVAGLRDERLRVSGGGLRLA